MPIGTILMYDGVGIDNVQLRTEQIGDDPQDTISMVGWFVCNGLVSTPNLINKFIVGLDTSGVEGGSNDAVVVQHIHPGSSGAQSANHTHTIGNQTVSHSHVINSGGSHAHDLKVFTSGGGSGSQYYPNTPGGLPESDIVQPIGDHNHTSGSQSASHSHTPGNQSANHNHVITVNNAGVSGTGVNRPLFYSMIFIVRMS